MTILDEFTAVDFDALSAELADLGDVEGAEPEGCEPETVEDAEAPAPEFASVAAKFEYIFAAYHSYVRRKVCAQVGDWHAAEDITAEMFTKLWREMSSGVTDVTDVTKLRTYLSCRAQWAISRFYAKMSAHRERLAKAEALPEDKDSDKTDPAPLPETVAVDRAEVRRLVAALPKPQRQAVALRVLCDLPVDHVAELIGVEESTVRSRYYEGIRALRAASGVAKSAGKAARGRSVSAAERDAEARRLFLASVASGRPMLRKELAAAFGLADLKWAARITAESGWTPPLSKRAEIMAAIEADITSGALTTGSVLPRTSHLAMRFEVPCSEVSGALQGLEKRHIVSRADGAWLAGGVTESQAPAVPLSVLPERAAFIAASALIPRSGSAFAVGVAR